MTEVFTMPKSFNIEFCSSNSVLIIIKNLGRNTAANKVDVP